MKAASSEPSADDSVSGLRVTPHVQPDSQGADVNPAGDNPASLLSPPDGSALLEARRAMTHSVVAQREHPSHAFQQSLS